jgi:adenine deaminase
MLKLAIFEKKKMKFANFMFMASEKFINEDINFELPIINNNVDVIEVIENQLITKKVNLKINNCNNFESYLNPKILKLAVVEK